MKYRQFISRAVIEEIGMYIKAGMYTKAKKGHVDVDADEKCEASEINKNFGLIYI